MYPSIFEPNKNRYFYIRWHSYLSGPYYSNVWIRFCGFFFSLLFQRTWCVYIFHWQIPFADLTTLSPDATQIYTYISLYFSNCFIAYVFVKYGMRCTVVSIITFYCLWIVFFLSFFFFSFFLVSVCLSPFSCLHISISVAWSIINKCECGRLYFYFI